MNCYVKIQLMADLWPCTVIGLLWSWYVLVWYCKGWTKGGFQIISRYPNYCILKVLFKYFSFLLIFKGFLTLGGNDHYSSSLGDLRLNLLSSSLIYSLIEHHDQVDELVFSWIMIVLYLGGQGHDRSLLVEVRGQKLGRTF